MINRTQLMVLLVGLLLASTACSHVLKTILVGENDYAWLRLIFDRYLGK